MLVFVHRPFALCPASIAASASGKDMVGCCSGAHRAGFGREFLKDHYEEGIREGTFG